MHSTGADNMDRQGSWFTAIYRGIIPESIRRKYSEIMHERKMNKKTLAELERKSFGDLNKDKTFYVVRTDNTQRWGVFSTYFFVLSNVKYAVEHGWTPVVDYKNYFLVGLQDDENRGKENAWNYYFEDLVPEFSLEDVYQSKNVILGPLRGQPYGSISWGDKSDIYDDKYRVYRQLAAKYLRVKSAILDEVEILYQKMFPEEERVLGVGIRAGAYWGSVTGDQSWKNHPKGKSVEQCIESIRNYMKKYHYNFFLLSCEDGYYVKTIKREMGDRCLCIDRPRVNFFDDAGEPNAVDDIYICNENYSVRQKNNDYIKEILLLTKCHSLALTVGGGNTAAFFLKEGKFENVWKMA